MPNVFVRADDANDEHGDDADADDAADDEHGDEKTFKKWTPRRAPNLELGEHRNPGPSIISSRRTWAQTT